jgi:hypothetical protein
LLRSKGKNTVDGTHRNLIENERQCCCKLLKSKVNNTKRWLSTIVCVCNWRWCRLFLRYRWCSLLMISLAALRHSIVNQQCKINPPPRFLSSWWIQYYRVGQNQNRMNKPYVNTTPYFKYNTWWFPRQKRRLYNVYIYIYIYIWFWSTLWIPPLYADHYRLPSLWCSRYGQFQWHWVARNLLLLQ